MIVYWYGLIQFAL